MAITADQAHAINPATGQIDMDLFRQFAHQQQGANASNSLGAGSSVGNSMLTQGQQYMAGNADVQQDAISRANSEGLFTGDAFSNRLDEIALQHFNLFGVADGRTGFGYTPPAAGSFSPNQGSTLSNFDASSSGGNANSPQTAAGGLPGFAQPLFDTSQYDSAFQSAVGNFNGLLDNYNSFFGDMLTNATNTQNQQPQYGGGFLPFATTLMPGGGNSNMGYNPFNTTTGSSSGGNWNSGSNFGNAIGNNVGQAANSSHRQWFTL